MRDLGSAKMAGRIRLRESRTPTFRVGATRAPTFFQKSPPVSQAGCRSLLLAAQTQLLDQGLVTPGVVTPEIVQQPSPLAHQLEQAPTRVMILLVRLEMLGEFVDPFGQDRDLDLRRAGIRLVGPEVLDDLSLAFSGNQGRVSLRASRIASAQSSSGDPTQSMRSL